MISGQAEHHLTMLGSGQPRSRDACRVHALSDAKLEAHSTRQLSRSPSVNEVVGDMKRAGLHWLGELCAPCF